MIQAAKTTSVTRSAMRSAAPKVIGTKDEATTYARQMTAYHADGDRWIVFAIPAGSMARRFGAFSSCRTSERRVYEAGGAVFVEASK